MAKRDASRRLRYFVPPATPITSNVVSPSLKLRPIGSSPGQNFFAILSLMIVTLADFSVSSSRKSRPRSSGKPVVTKKRGLTVIMSIETYSLTAGVVPCAGGSMRVPPAETGSELAKVAD